MVRQAPRETRLGFGPTPAELQAGLSARWHRRRSGNRFCMPGRGAATLVIDRRKWLDHFSAGTGMPTMPTLTHACVRLLRPVFGLVLLAPVPILGDTVFKSSGPDGTVYSDTPSPGSREIDLPLPNVAEPSAKPAAKPAVKPEASPQPDDAAPPQVAYQSLRITQPEDDGSAGDNTANFEVRVAVEPALRYQLGHAFVVTLNGRAVEQAIHEYRDADSARVFRGQHSRERALSPGGEDRGS